LTELFPPSRVHPRAGAEQSLDSAQADVRNLAVLDRVIMTFIRDIPGRSGSCLGLPRLGVLGVLGVAAVLCLAAMPVLAAEGGAKTAPNRF